MVPELLNYYISNTGKAFIHVMAMGLINEVQIARPQALHPAFIINVLMR